MGPITRAWFPNTLLHQSEAMAVFMTLLCAVHPLGVGMSPWRSRQRALGMELVDWFITQQLSEPEEIRWSMRGQYFFFLSWNKEVWLACNPFSTLEPGIYSKVNLTQITSLCPRVCWLHVAPRWSPPSVTRYEVVPAHLSSALVPPPMCSLMQTYWLEILCVLCSFISISLLLYLLIICMVLPPLLFACFLFFF